MDQANSRIVGTPMVWIYVVASTALTALTFLVYYLLLHRDRFVFRNIKPKASERNLQNLRRKWTNLTRGDVELQRFPSQS